VLFFFLIFPTPFFLFLYSCLHFLVYDRELRREGKTGRMDQMA
jgi:hypothetical protein